MSTSSQFWWASSSSFSWSLGATQPDASLAIVSWISSIWINRQAKCNCYYVFGGFFLLFELCKTLTAVKNKLITIGGGAKGEDRDRGGDCNRLRFMWFRVKRARLCKRYQGSTSRMDELRMSGWADEPKIKCKVPWARNKDILRHFLIEMITRSNRIEIEMEMETAIRYRCRNRIGITWFDNAFGLVRRRKNQSTLSVVQP